MFRRTFLKTLACATAAVAMDVFGLKAQTTAEQMLKVSVTRSRLVSYVNEADRAAHPDVFLTCEPRFVEITEKIEVPDNGEVRAVDFFADPTVKRVRTQWPGEGLTRVEIIEKFPPNRAPKDWKPIKP